MHRDRDRTAKSAKRIAGFTIIELLVVVSIISLLIAILLPSLRQAREAALNAQCLARLRSLGVMVTLYTMDHRDYMPMSSGYKPGDTHHSNDNNAPAWYVYFRDNMGLPPEALFCPSAGAGNRIWEANTNQFTVLSGHTGPHRWWGIDYSLNSANNRYSRRNDQWQSAGFPPDFRHIRGLERPSEVMAVTEGASEFVGGWPPGNTLALRHMSAASINVLYFDGHAQTIGETGARGTLIEIGAYAELPWVEP